uniref:Uncharacterized protein n=1 Tax=Setaria viridis TaxID=4556 RepID=A0A4U6TN94_SETVI|nr:hypothetical protein SEVIR_8G261950v2 [Setaria viridis]
MDSGVFHATWNNVSVGLFFKTDREVVSDPIGRLLMRPMLASGTLATPISYSFVIVYGQKHTTHASFFIWW